MTTRAMGPRAATAAAGAAARLALEEDLHEHDAVALGRDGGELVEDPSHHEHELAWGLSGGWGQRREGGGRQGRATGRCLSCRNVGVAARCAAEVGGAHAPYEAIMMPMVTTAMIAMVVKSFFSTPCVGSPRRG